MVVTTVPFGGAKSPKLTKMIVSQNTSMTRNGMGIDRSRSSNNNSRNRPRSMPIPSIWVCRRRWSSLWGERRSIRA
jgi:hypothetical protein